MPRFVKAIATGKVAEWKSGVTLLYMKTGFSEEAVSQGPLGSEAGRTSAWSRATGLREVTQPLGCGS